MIWTQIEVGVLMILLSSGVQMGQFLWQRKKLREESDPAKSARLTVEVEECLRRLADLEDEKKQERKDDVGVRERLRYIEAKINMVGWRKEH
jgi:hypothetical protein